MTYLNEIIDLRAAIDLRYADCCAIDAGMCFASARGQALLSPQIDSACPQAKAGLLIVRHPHPRSISSPAVFLAIANRSLPEPLLHFAPTQLGAQEIIDGHLCSGPRSLARRLVLAASHRQTAGRRRPHCGASELRFRPRSSRRPMTPANALDQFGRRGPARGGLWKRLEAQRLRRLVLDDFAIHPAERHRERRHLNNPVRIDPPLRAGAAKPQLVLLGSQ